MGISTKLAFCCPEDPHALAPPPFAAFDGQLSPQSTATDDPAPGPASVGWAPDSVPSASDGRLSSQTVDGYLAQLIRRRTAAAAAGGDASAAWL